MSEEDPFSLLLAVAKHVRIDPDKNMSHVDSLASDKSEMEILTNTLKVVSGVETSLRNSSEQQQQKQRQSSTTNGATTGSFFLDDSEDGQIVYRRASVQFFPLLKANQAHIIVHLRAAIRGRQNCERRHP